MRTIRLFLRKEGGSLAATVGLATVAWALAWGISTPKDLARPVEYCCDAMFYLGTVKAYGDRGLGGLWGDANPNLSAPAAAHWQDFPLEDAIYVVLGLVARVTGAITALTLGALATVLLAATAMFVAARRLRVPRPLAMLAGCLFSLSPYFHYRGLQHFGPSVHWHLPLCILIWVWCSARGGLGFKRRFGIACTVMAIAGTLNLYYLNYVMHVLALILVLHLVRRRWRPSLAVLGVMAAGGVTAGLTNLDTVLYMTQHGKNASGGVRQASETYLYALRPIELVTPGYYHRIDALAAIGERYRKSAPVLGEFPSTYLGAVPILGLAAMILCGLGAALRLGRRDTNQRFLVFAAVLLVLGVGGGLMAIEQQLIGQVIFRANNRASVVILALSLLALGRILSPVARRLPTRLAWGIAVPLTIFGLWEQTPDSTKRDGYPGGMTQARARATYPTAALSDERFTRELEAALPEGAGVFQLPVVPFPEAGGMGSKGDYEHFRLYINTTKLRFSYGGMKGRPEAAFAHETASLPAQQMIERLRAHGFGVVVLANAVYAPNSAAQLAQAASVGTPARVLRSEDGDWTAVFLNATQP